MSVQLTKCLFCNSSLEEYWSGFCQCKHCRLILKNPMPTEDELIQLYQSSWNKPLCRREETGGMTPELANDYVTKLCAILGKDSLSGLTIVDFGAGKGEIAIALLSKGADVYAIEPFGYEYLQENGIHAYKNLEELPNDVVFDGIFSGNVIEHLTAPWDDIQSLTNVLKPGGWLLLATPNAAGLNARLSSNNWRELPKPGHIVFFTEDSLTSVLSSCGYERIERPKMYINYVGGTVSRFKHHFLEFAGLGGELRMMAWKS